MKQSWYVSIVGINQEFLAQRGISAKGFECYCPIGRKVVRHARREEIRIFPVFSRYLFINFTADPEGLSQVRATDGIIDVITNNWQPVEISDEVIEEIKTRETSGAFNQKPPPHLHKQKWSKSFDTLKKLLEPCA